jgi:acetyl esterase/lipase
MPLWEQHPPHSLGGDPHDQPFIEIFRPAADVATGSAMLIFPGGAYSFLSPRSGEQYAHWLALAGITGMVVNFRLGSHGYRYRALLADACQALALVQANANRWALDPDRVGVIGTSAGGHLASMLMTGAAFEFADATSCEVSRPQVAVLCYPVISLRDPLAHRETRENFLGVEQDKQDLQSLFSADLRVTNQTSPCFLWHTNEDEEVSPAHTRLLADVLRAHSVPHEMHLYESGPHALGLAREQGLHWAADCIRWLRRRGF